MTDTYQRSGMGLIAPDDFMTPIIPFENEEEQKKRAKQTSDLVSLVVDPDELEKKKDFQARAGVVGYQDTQPDDYAKSIKTAKELGVHPDVVNVDRTAWEIDLGNNVNAAIVTGNPKVRDWINKDSANIQTSRDELPKLDGLTRYLENGWMVAKKTNPYIWSLVKIGKQLDMSSATEDMKAAYDAHYYGINAYKYQFGDLSVLPQLLEYESKIKNKKESGSMWVTRTFAEFLGGMAAATPEAAKYGIGGAITGGAIGAIGGGPGAPVTAPIGTISGGVVGTITGFALQSAMASSGSIYRELDLLRDSYGAPVSEEAKQVLALTGGFLVGTLEMAGGKLTKTAISELLTKMAGNVAIKEAIAQKLVSLARYGAQGAAINAAQSLAEDMSKQLALITENAAKDKRFETVINNPQERGKIFDRFVESAAQGGLLAGTISAPGVFLPHQRHTPTDTLQVFANQNRLDEAMRMAADAKIRERNPDGLADLVNSVQQEKLSIPLEVVIANKEAFSFIPDLEVQLQRAVETGTDITTTVGEYATKLPPELHPAVRDFVRQGEKDQTPAEAMAMEEAQKQLAEQQKMQETGVGPPPAAQVLPPAAVEQGKAAVATLPETAVIPPQQLEIPGLDQPVELPEITVQSGLIKRLFSDQVAPPPIDVGIAAMNTLRLKAGLNRIVAPPTPDTQLEFSLRPPEPHAFPPTPEPKPVLGPTGEGAYLIPKKQDAEATIARDALPKAEAEAQFLAELKTQVRAVKLVEDSIFELAIRRDPKSLEEFHKFIDEEAKKVAEVKRQEAIKHTEQQVEAPPKREPGEITHEEMVSIWGEEKVGAKPPEPAKAPEIDTDDIHAAADIAYSSWLTDTTAKEGAAVVQSLDDVDAKNTAIQTGTSIDRQRKLMWLQPLFDSPKAIGMTMKDFARYSKHIQEVQRKITQAVWDAAHKVIKQKETKRWKELAKEIGPEVEDAVARRPEIFIADYLTTGKVRFETEGALPHFKLNAKDVDTLFAREELEAMGVKEGENISDVLPGKFFIKDPKRQVSADDLATMFQQGSGRYLIRMLMESETAAANAGENRTQRYTRLVKEGINERLTREHGDLNEIILRESMAAVVDVAQLKVLTAEMDALAGGGRVDAEAVRKHIVDGMKKMTIEEATELERFQRQAGDYGLKAEQALLANDPVGAFQAKQMQFMAFVRSQTAVELKRQMGTTNKIVNKYSLRNRVDSVDEAYNTRILQLLQQSGVLLGRSRDEVNLAADIKKTGNLSLNEWIAAQQERGEILAQPTFLIDLQTQKKTVEDFKSLTVEQFQEFSKVLTDLDNVGTDKKFVQSAHARIQFEAFISQLEENLAHRLDDPTKYRTDMATGWFKHRLRAMDAQLIKPETLLIWLDANDPNGPMTQFFYRNFKEGQAKFEALEKKYHDMIQAALPKDLNLKEKTENTWLYDEYGNLAPLSRKEMFNIAGLFFSNEKTKKHLLDSYGWTDQDVYQYLLTNMKSKDDWDYIASIYRVYDDINSHKSEVYRQIRGYGDEPPDPIIYADRYGRTQTGGYWPITNSDSWQFEKHGIVDRRQYNPMPSEHIMLEDIRGLQRPNLDFTLLGYRIREDLHDIAYRPAVVNALRMLENGKVQSLIKDAYGKEYSDLLVNWVHEMANDTGWRDDRGGSAVEKLLRYAGQAVITHLVGFSFATASIHSTSAGANTAAELQKKTIKASYQVLGGRLQQTSDWIFRNPRNTELATTFAWDNSPELRTRWNRDQHNLVKALGHWNKFQAAQWHYQWWAQSIISYTDYMTAVVAWHGMYHDAQEKGRSHEDSVFLADRLVRAAHGGVAMLDKSAIQRNLAVTPFVMFYGYFNHNYNQMRRFGKEAQSGSRDTFQNLSDGEFKKIGERMRGPFWAGMAYLAGYVLVPALIHEAVRGVEKEDEETSLGAFMTKAVVSQAAGTIPLVRDMVYAALHPGVPSGMPLQQIFSSTAYATRAIKTISEGEAPKLGDLLLTPLLAAKFSSKTLIRLINYLDDAEQDAPRNVREWKNLVLYGQPNQPGVKRKKAKVQGGYQYLQ